jgi:hypothetical protein
MAKWSYSHAYPAPMPSLGRVRDAAIVDYRTGRDIARAQNWALMHCRKVVMTKSWRFNSTPSAGVEDAVTGWRFRFHSGLASSDAGPVKLHAEVILTAIAVAPEPGTYRPRWRIVADDGGTPVESDWRYHAKLHASTGSPALNNLFYGSVEIEIDPDTDYECYFETADFAVLLGAVVYEVHPAQVSDADSIVTNPGLMRDLSDVTDAQHKKICAENGHSLWKRNAAHLFTLVPDTLAGTWTRDGTVVGNGYANILDQSEGPTVDANSPGFSLNTLYHRPVHTTGVPVVLAAYGQRSFSDGNVRLADSGGALVTVAMGASLDWYTQTGTLTAADAHKVDVLFNTNAGGSITVHAVSLYEYLA